LQRYQDALETYDIVINLNLDKTYDEVVAIGALYNSDAWYNKAGIESMRKNKKQALEHLRIAISLNKKYKEKAKTDSCFDNIRDSQEFKELVEG